MKSGVFILATLQILIITSLCAQDHEEVIIHEHESESNDSFHSISLIIGHTHIPKGFDRADNNMALIVPSWGLNYVFHFNEKWAIGWLNDMEIATYMVQKSEGDEIVRERPIITSLVGIFKPNKHIGLLAGFGREFEKHQNFWVLRIGIEIEIEINESWAMLPALTYDVKEEIYDSWTVGLAVAKRF